MILNFSRSPISRYQFLFCFSNQFRVRALTAAVAFLVCLSSTGQAQSALDGFNPNANDKVHVVVVQPDGKILIGGSFEEVLGVTRNKIARLNPDGTLDMAFNPNASNCLFNRAAAGWQNSGRR